MIKKTVLAMAVAVLLPVISYLLVRYYSDRDVKMPHRYFYDDVIQRGRTNDTLWHHVSDTRFINQFGKSVSLNDLNGKIIVLDFFFTRCPTICPKLAKAMKRLQNSFTNNDTIVQF